MTPVPRGRLKRVLLTNHVLSGALIGALARRPLPAFAAGVASHFVLDAMPHWGQWGSQRRFLRVAVPDGLGGDSFRTTLVEAGHFREVLSCSASSRFGPGRQEVRTGLGTAPAYPLQRPRCAR